MTENENQGATVERIIARDTPTAQGEPSDAQVRAACQTFAATEWNVSTFEAMRAALRAALTVGEVR